MNILVGAPDQRCFQDGLWNISRSTADPNASSWSPTTGREPQRLDFEDSEALDTGLIAAGQAVEHYEISRYGTLRARANSACVMPQGSSTRRSGRRRRRTSF
jgi:hypothetical protein